MNPPKDRRKLLLSQTALNGIDFVEVDPSTGAALRVHFLIAAPALVGKVTGASISGGDRVPNVPVAPVDPAQDWSADGEGRPVLTLHVAAPGDFSHYTLALTHDGVLDPHFDHALFSFKAGCPRTADCKAPVPAPAPQDEVSPVTDTLARDFESFKRALFEHMARRFPAWRERSEADIGVMLLEVLASVADDLAYTQDRIAAEATLPTATHRKSLVRHARLVDHEPRPAVSATAILRVTARPSVDVALVPPGSAVLAAGPSGAPIPFEVGRGLTDGSAGYPIRAAWNELTAHVWDDEERCLPAGATEVWIVGHGLGLTRGQQILVETAPESPASSPQRQIVVLAEDGVEEVDPLPAPTPVTRLRLRDTTPIAEARDLERTHVSANLIPATQGRRRTVRFGPGEAEQPFVRTGPNRVPVRHLALPRPARGAPGAGEPLAWRPADPRFWTPEIRVIHANTTPPVVWRWRRSLLEAAPGERAFTIDPVRMVVVRPARQDGSVSVDIDGSEGETLRIGDGVFGAPPAPEAAFEVTYHTCAGVLGNVARDTLVSIDATGPLAALASHVTNPFPAAGGQDPESDDEVKRTAPHAFHATLARAVRPEDHARIAETLPFVSRAGTTVRHTGSWLSTFTAVDPKGSTLLADADRAEVTALLDRVRQAGTDSHVPDPRHVALDLRIRLCALPGALRAEVERAVTDALVTGFFHPDRFTFGVPLCRSALEAAVARVPGVHGVRSVLFRRRGEKETFALLPMTLPVAPHEIVRVDHNKSRPEMGSIHVIVEGGQ